MPKLQELERVQEMELNKKVLANIIQEFTKVNQQAVEGFKALTQRMAAQEAQIVKLQAEIRAFQNCTTKVDETMTFLRQQMTDYKTEIDKELQHVLDSLQGIQNGNIQPSGGTMQLVLDALETCKQDIGKLKKDVYGQS